jgi:hypothetical protein
MYIGNNDWNVYCFSNYSGTYGQISAKLDKNQIEKGEAVTGNGQITPRIAYAPITVSFIKSDGTVNKIQVKARDDGTFSLNYIPDEVGDWTVSIRCSGASYIMESVELFLKVVEKQQSSIPEQTPPEHEEPTNGQTLGMPTEYVTGAVVTLIVAVIAIVAYLFVKKRDTSSPVTIID